MKASWSKKQDDGSYGVWITSTKESDLKALKMGQKIKVKSRAGDEKEVMLDECRVPPREKDGEYITMWSVTQETKAKPKPQNPSAKSGLFDFRGSRDDQEEHPF